LTSGPPRAERAAGERWVIIEHLERHDDGLARLLEVVDARLRGALVAGALLGDGRRRGPKASASSRRGLRDGCLGYASILARRA
jgi:hypothetical protein